MDISSAAFRVEAPLTIAADAVHLWRVDLEATSGDEGQWLGVLSPDERTRAARFHRERDRRYFIAGRALLRQVLAGYLEADPKNLIFSYSAKNKPSLGGAYAEGGLAFNVSHSGDIALFAVTRDRVIGVDVEQIRHDFDTAAIAKRFFSTIEQEQLAALPMEQRHGAFFRCWTRKEAFIKAVGDGLSLPLDQFDVSIAPFEQNALLATRLDEVESKRWSLRDLVVKLEYAAAVCASGMDWHLIDWSGSTIEPCRD